MRLRDVVILIRPHHYLKNGFVFMPLFFVGRIMDVKLLFPALGAFAAFCAAAGAIYVLNDCMDMAEDRLHPRKKLRPVASGAVSRKAALVLAGVLCAMGGCLMAAVSLDGLAVLGAYVALNLGYTFYLKHIAIVDVTVIAIGFVLRLFAGSRVTGVPLSMWIVIMTFLLALFLALSKRRDDVLIFMNSGERMRRVIDGYTLQLIDGAMMIMASVVIVAYILYTTSAPVLLRLHTEHLYLTALFVILGILRYLQITLVDNGSGSPTMIVLKDRFMQVTILAWIVSFVWIIYL
ncbi:MAG: UbiA prenyltransferase family protein [Pseudomonadota bacterium]